MQLWHLMMLALLVVGAFAVFKFVQARYGRG